MLHFAGSPVQFLVGFRFSSFPYWQFGCFSLKKSSATILHGLLQLIAISTSVVEAMYSQKRHRTMQKCCMSYTRVAECLRHIPHISDVFWLVIKGCCFSNNKVHLLQFWIKKQNLLITKKPWLESLECRTGQAGLIVPEFYHYATLTVDWKRERFMIFIPLKKDNEIYYALVFFLSFLLLF